MTRLYTPIYINRRFKKPPSRFEVEVFFVKFFEIRILFAFFCTFANFKFSTK